MNDDSINLDVVVNRELGNQLLSKAIKEMGLGNHNRANTLAAYAWGHFRLIEDIPSMRLIKKDFIGSIVHPYHGNWNIDQSYYVNVARSFTDYTLELKKKGNTPYLLELA